MCLIESPTLSIQQEARKACEQQSAHFHVCWSNGPFDHRQVVEVFLKSFRQVSQASLLLSQNLWENRIEIAIKVASATRKVYLSYLSKTFLVDDRPFNVAIRNAFRVSFPNGFDGTNQRPEFIQFTSHPSHSPRSSDLFINPFQCHAQSFLFRPD